MLFNSFRLVIGSLANLKVIVSNARLVFYGSSAFRLGYLYISRSVHANITQFSTCTKAIIHLFNPTKFCIIIVSSFSWDIFMSQEKSKIMHVRNFGGVKEVYYGICAGRECNKHSILRAKMCLLIHEYLK